MIDTVSGQSFCVSRRISMPSRSSSRRSVSTTSNSCSRSCISASVALVTAVTSLPSSSRMALIVVATLCSSSTTRTLLVAICRRSPDRKRDRECGPLARAAPYLQRSAVCLNDAVRDPESETGAFLHLRGEEWLEDPRHRFLVDPGAGVPNVDAYDVRRLRIEDAATGLRRDDQPSTVGHRLGGVEEQVQEHLLQLIRGGADERQRRLELLLDAHAVLTEAFLDER